MRLRIFKLVRYASPVAPVSGSAQFPAPDGRPPWPEACARNPVACEGPLVRSWARSNNNETETVPLFDAMMVRVLLLGPALKVGTRLHPVCSDALAAHRVSAPVVRMWQRDQSVAR